MRTLRGRLALITTAVVAIMFVITGVVLVGATGRARDRQLELDLAERLQLLQPATGRPTLPGTRPDRFDNLSDNVVEQLRDTAQRTLGPGFFVVVRNGDNVLLTLGDAPDDLPTTGRAGQVSRYTADDGRTYVVRTGTSGPRGVSLLIGADRDRVVAEEQQDLRNRVAAIGAVATLVTGLVTFFGAGVVTRPLRGLREATATVAETEDLTTRVDVEGAPAEIATVADGLNTMLARLEASTTARERALHAARRFAADAGHEMRTPLTAMQTTLESLSRNTDLPATTRQEAIEEVTAETRRLTALLQSLQTLARADAGLPDDVGVLDLADVVEQAADAIRQRHPGVTVTVHAPGSETPVNGSPTWLRSITDNLLRNAAIHGRPDGTITATVSVSNGTAWLVVDDDGPGFPADQRDRVFERFTRGADATGRPGSGLGLSLVAQLVGLHGGTVAVDDSPQGGARVRVALPLATR